MPLTLDHIVIVVADLAAAISDYEALGFKVSPGGEHGGGVTHNALVAFEDGAYLELIAFRRPDPANRWWRVFARAGEGLVDFALLPSDIDSDLAAAHARGLDLDGPVPGSRLRPDGERLAWQIARSPRADVPFLCADVTPRRLRVPEGRLRRHANGVTGVAELVVVVEGIGVSRARYAALLGSPSDPAATAGGRDASEAALLIGPVRLRLVSPGERPDADPAMRAALDARGEGLFSVAFAAPAGAERLDPARLHGARLSLAPTPPARRDE